MIYIKSCVRTHRKIVLNCVRTQQYMDTTFYVYMQMVIYVNTQTFILCPYADIHHGIITAKLPQMKQR